MSKETGHKNRREFIGGAAAVIFTLFGVGFAASKLIEDINPYADTENLEREKHRRALATIEAYTQEDLINLYESLPDGLKNGACKITIESDLGNSYRSGTIIESGDKRYILTAGHNFGIYNIDTATVRVEHTDGSSGVLQDFGLHYEEVPYSDIAVIALSEHETGLVGVAQESLIEVPETITPGETLYSLPISPRGYKEANFIPKKFTLNEITYNAAGAVALLHANDQIVYPGSSGALVVTESGQGVAIITQSLVDYDNRQIHSIDTTFHTLSGISWLMNQADINRQQKLENS